MNDITNYCEYLYNTIYLPIYYYEKEELIFSYPKDETRIIPPSLYRNKLLSTQKKVTYTLTSFYGYYGLIRLSDTESYLIIGPSNTSRYSNETLNQMLREYGYTSEEKDLFSEFFYKIPPQVPDVFINTLLLINYNLNQTPLKRSDIRDSDNATIDVEIYKQFANATFRTKEEGLINESYQIEQELVHYIETGNVMGIKKFYDQAKLAHVGTIANDGLRQFKNMAVILVTLSSRAAIRGGLTPSVSYSLANIYLQQIERLSEMESLYSLILEVQTDYANRVATSITPATTDQVIFDVVKYIHENTHMPLNVTDIATHMNFSRSYLSRKFKKVLGFDLSTFIRRCKLEEAKDLLLFSNKSISSIANYLCFSSQSHFQRAFKEQYDITPQSFRNLGPTALTPSHRQE